MNITIDVTKVTKADIYISKGELLTDILTSPRTSFAFFSAKETGLYKNIAIALFKNPFAILKGRIRVGIN